MTIPEANEWQWWQQALDNPKDIGGLLPVSPDSPEQGFYKVRYKKDQPWKPVAIWKEDDEWIALRSGRSIDAAEIWNYCCRHPITNEAYEQALNGGGWADDDPSVASMIGDNVGDIGDATILADQIENAKQGAEAYRDIENEEQASKAQSLRARMNELAGMADKQREALKKPHLEAGKAVDKQWMPLVKEAKAVADQLRKYIETFKTAQLTELRRIEAERQRAEAEKGTDEEAVIPPPLPPIDTTIKGNYGRGATVGTRMVVTGITDPIELFRHLRTGNDELHQLLMKLAQKQVDAGFDVPGVTIEEQAYVR